MYSGWGGGPGGRGGGSALCGGPLSIPGGGGGSGGSRPRPHHHDGHRGNGAVLLHGAERFGHRLGPCVPQQQRRLLAAQATGRDRRGRLTGALPVPLGQAVQRGFGREVLAGLEAQLAGSRLVRAGPAGEARGIRGLCVQLGGESGRRGGGRRRGVGERRERDAARRLAARCPVLPLQLRGEALQRAGAEMRTRSRRRGSAGARGAAGRGRPCPRRASPRGLRTGPRPCGFPRTPCSPPATTSGSLPDPLPFS